jgi:MOSC domain-containing protein YiiM
VRVVKLALEWGVQVLIRHLFVSPGHNFFGHHGRPADENPTLAVERVQCRAGRGIEGDRFFDYKPDYNGQITFFDWAACVGLREELKRPELGADVFRRNVVIEGLDLNSLIGRRFILGGVTFEGMAEAKPCYWMDSAAGPGAEAWLRGRGGLRAKIRSDGALTPGWTDCEVVDGQLPLGLPASGALQKG